MPILKRRHGQVLLIGPDVKITVIAIQKGAVTLQVEAPPSFKITRAELNPLEGTNATDVLPDRLQSRPLSG